ncbi:hypothetical protein [Streptomyces sp. MST-110588]|uniref:hypothetical protein n=1 Tax=Streptomyces sp. MST-110588 TaxID=2833628 RepID=UPI001F5D8101|nr:hypothetical protein [Streptomyces sp. MST-110588]UNO41321.1 hypothetical protein KGS77_19300 [Streptomyces sp. MST-110588]
MKSTIVRRTGISLAAVAVLAGATACDGGSDKADGKKGGSEARTAMQVINAAFKKTSAAKSAKVDMTMTMPGAASKGGGTTKMSGVMGWDPTVMDMNVDMSASPAAGGKTPPKSRVLMVDNVMYASMDPAAMAGAGKELAGKKWLKIDMLAAARQSGNQQLMKQMTAGLDANQDPAKQLGMLIGSPSIKHVGSEKVNGQDAEHYKGHLTIEEATKLNKDNGLSAEDRQKLVEGAKKAGIKGYDLEVWVNGEDYPVKMTMGMDSPKGMTNITANYSDYGAKASVQAPPANETLDLVKMLKDLQKAKGGTTA